MGSQVRTLPGIDAAGGGPLHEYEGRVKFCKLNVAENRKLVISLRVMGVPTFLFYKGGEIVERLSGAEAVPDAIRTKVENLA